MIFFALQAVGGLCCLGAHFFQSPPLWLFSLALLLPGSLLGWLQFHLPGYSGGHWSLLTRGLLAVIANVILFALGSLLLGPRRIESSSPTRRVDRS